MNSIKRFIQPLYSNTFLGRLLVNTFYRLRNRLLPEKYYVRNKFKKVYGVYPNLEDPKTLNEKIVWLKLNDRTSLHTTCADKYAVRSYVKDKIGDRYLIPLLYKSKNPRDITYENMPDEPVVIKTNHDSGGVIFLNDKSSANWPEIQKSLKKRLKTNYYWRSKEWQHGQSASGRLDGPPGKKYLKPRSHMGQKRASPRNVKRYICLFRLLKSIVQGYRVQCLNLSKIVTKDFSIISQLYSAMHFSLAFCPSSAATTGLEKTRSISFASEVISPAGTIMPQPSKINGKSATSVAMIGFAMAIASKIFAGICP